MRGDLEVKRREQGLLLVVSASAVALATSVCVYLAHRIRALRTPGVPNRQILTPNSSIPETAMPVDSGLYEALMAFFMHQDRLVWDITQLLIAAQGGVLASSFILRRHWSGPIILLFGAFLTLVLLALQERCASDRDVNLALMDKLADRLLPDSIKEDLQREGKAASVRVGATAPRWYATLRGRFARRTVLIVFILGDVLLAGLYSWAGFLFP
jgi:hypothetical protein